MVVQSDAGLPPDGAETGRFTVELLRRWCTEGLVLLTAAQHDIDALNVFPVPDGDTGTNVLLTWQAATAALEEAGESPTPGASPLGADLTSVSALWARAALLGARGNSGVIIAQMLRGVAESLSAPGVDSRDDPGQVIAAALSRAAELAYAGVARPVEGTILTVAAEAAKAARNMAGAGASTGAVAIVVAASEAAADALARTPQQLPALAAAGVVDAGGQALVLLLDALRAAIDPNAPTPDEVLASHRLAGVGVGAGAGVGAATASSSTQMASAVAVAQLGAPDGGAFEVMYLLEAQDEVAPQVRRQLDELGTSVVVVGGGGLWNIHVHTDHAGPAVEAGVAAGRVFRIRITPLDFATDHREVAAPQLAKVGDRVVVAVANGPTLGELFESVGARVVVGGPGKRPTPSALVTAAAGAREVLLLPNDDDHLAAADTAAAELRAGGAHVAVLRTHADVQGLAAAAVHDPQSAFTDDVVAMSAAAAATRFGAIACAEREAMTSAGICHAGQILGVVEGDIVVLGDSADQVATAVVDRMLAAGGELVTLVCGSDPLPGRPVADAVRAHLHQTRRDVEIAVYDGGQPLYPLLIGVE